MKVLYPASFTNCETFGDEKLEVVSPETVRAPEELERPEPRRLLNELPLRIKFVVEAVAKEA